MVTLVVVGVRIARPDISDNNAFLKKKKNLHLIWIYSGAERLYVFGLCESAHCLLQNHFDTRVAR